jgi:hypothetical protein
MSYDRQALPHSFHIPVMGTAFTIDAPLRVARYGISSVISLVDDVLIEQMREYHSDKSGRPYEKIPDSNIDARELRITAYLNLLDTLIQQQVKDLRNSPFEPGSEITRYYDMLPESPLKDDYHRMQQTVEPAEKASLQADLRARTMPGAIDVNIMTKLDRLRQIRGSRLPAEYSDAKSALRGFARSDLSSSIVCSAGMNREFYNYFTAFDDFFPGPDGAPRKKIILKVSDYRSAEIQGRFLAKRGLWVSEYRIESGLNCGGHAFATKGYLLGPILEEFKQKKDPLREKLHSVYSEALKKKDRAACDDPLDVRITVQGGIGTTEENQLLLDYYAVDSTGWGTPFMLVPEVVSIDDEHFEKLAAATADDVYLSGSSPLGAPFWNLRTSASEEMRRERIGAHHPGSPCKKGYIRTNTEVTESPTCVSSFEYQNRKLQALESEDLSPDEYSRQKDAVLSKSCICHDLAGGATVRYGIEPDATPAICCGPNIVNFFKIETLENMIDHIYGRKSIIDGDSRTNMYIRELMLYIDYYREEVTKGSRDLTTSTRKYLLDFKMNLLEGIDYYSTLAERFTEEVKDQIILDLDSLKAELELIPVVV